jgi:hypothetical protein
MRGRGARAMCRHGVLVACLSGALVAALFSGSQATGAATATPTEPVRVAIDPARFTTTIDNPWFPLVPGTTLVYVGSREGTPARDTVTVTTRTKRIVGVDTVIVEDKGYLAGRLAESTRDYYAQDDIGAVWYLGEDTAEYDRHGKVVSTEGTWLSGRDGAQPGIIMDANPVVGKRIRQEYLRGHAEDWYRVIDLARPVTVPYGSFPDALMTAEWTPLEPAVRDRKYYVRGIGEVRELAVRGPNEVLDLQHVIRSGA